MVLSVRSQIRQITGHFIRQPRLFEYFQNTTSGMENFFIPIFKNKLYGNKKNQIEHGSIKAYWSKLILLHTPRGNF